MGLLNSVITEELIGEDSSAVNETDSTILIYKIDKAGNIFEKEISRSKVRSVESKTGE